MKTKSPVKAVFELSPLYNRVKSFYGKAHIVETENGERFLISYKTPVCGFTAEGFKRYWSGYSSTTMRHISEARRQLEGVVCYGKKEWDTEPISSAPAWLVGVAV